MKQISAMQILVIILLLLVILGGIFYLLTISDSDSARLNVNKDQMDNTVADSQDVDILAEQALLKDMAAPALRLRLNFLLRENIGMTLKAARGAYAELPSQEAARNIARKNNTRIAALLGSIYDLDVQAKVEEILATRIDSFENYAVSLRSMSGVDGRLAKEKIVNNARDLRLLLTNLNPELNDEILGEILGEDTRIMQIAIDNFASDDYTNSYVNERSAYENMGDLSDFVSDGISEQFPLKYPGDPGGETVEFESKLNARLREDVNMHIDFMRYVYDQKDTRQASLAAITINSEDIAQIMQQVYGDDSGELFLNLWNTRTDLFERYTQARRSSDEDALTRIDTEIGQYALVMAQFFAVYNQLLPESSLQDLILQDTQLIRDALDAYVVGDYTQSFEFEHLAYEHMGTLGRTLTQNLLVEFPGVIQKTINQDD